jgi:hypothetical protein
MADIGAKIIRTVHDEIILEGNGRNPRSAQRALN